MIPNGIIYNPYSASKIIMNQLVYHPSAVPGISPLIQWFSSVLQIFC